MLNRTDAYTFCGTQLFQKSNPPDILSRFPSPHPALPNKMGTAPALGRTSLRPRGLELKTLQPKAAKSNYLHTPSTPTPPLAP